MAASGRPRGHPRRRGPVDLRRPQGEFAAVVGPSGCGKSTLMKLATGLAVSVKGNGDRRRQKVSKPVKIAGMAFQNPTCCRGARRSTTFCCRSRSSSRTAARMRAATRPNMSRAPKRCSRRSACGGFGLEISLAIVRRHAAAHLAVPRADPRAATPDARRAVRRARRLHARGIVVRDPRPARGARASRSSS